MRAAALLCALVLLAPAAVAGHAGAATSTTVVTANVPSATSIDASGCTGAGLSLGTLAVATTSTTTADCDVLFGSSNDTSSLRVSQTDGRNTALAAPADASSTARLSGATQLGDVSMGSATTGWATGTRSVASNATLLKTTDAGVTFVPQAACNGSNATIVLAASASTVVVGLSSTVCRSTDGGATWSTIGGLPGGSWRDGKFFNATTGYMTSNTGNVVVTTDGGATWTQKTSPQLAGQNIDLIRVVPLSPTELVVAGIVPAGARPVVAARSTDSGTTWSVTTLIPSSTFQWVPGIDADPANNTVIVTTWTSGFRSTDRGATFPTTTPGGYSTIHASGTNWIVAQGGNPTSSYMRSTDGGVTWGSLPLPCSCLFEGTASGNGTDLVGVAASNTVATSADAGATWTTRSSAPTFMSAAAWDANGGVAVGNRDGIRSIDGGSTVQTSTLPGPGSVAYRAVATSGPGVAVAVGDGGTIARSTDSGATWSAVTSGTGTSLNSVDDAGGGVLLAGGGASTVLRSADGGSSWAPVAAAPPSAAVNDVAAAGTTIAVAGNAGKVYVSGDNGATWATRTTPFADPVYKVEVRSALDIAAGFWSPGGATTTGKVATSHDGGATWVTSTGFDSYLTDIAFPDPRTILATVGGGSLWRSDDGGTTWSLSHNVGVYPNGLAAVDADTFWTANNNDTFSLGTPPASFADYVGGSTDFSGAASVFGACLRNVVGAASTPWTPATGATCATGVVANWNAVPTAPTTVARTPTSGTATASFRFGARLAASQRPGNYFAALTFKVVAPAV